MLLSFALLGPSNPRGYAGRKEDVSVTTSEVLALSPWVYIGTAPHGRSVSSTPLQRPESTKKGARSETLLSSLPLGPTSQQYYRLAGDQGLTHGLYETFRIQVSTLIGVESD